MNGSGSRRPVWLVALALSGLTLAVYWPAVRCEFVNFDDPHYVTGNDFVRGGLTFDNLVSAFTVFHSGNWHPLTWISHALDCQLFGLNSPGHHLVSILLHSLNAALMLLLFHRMTGAVWRSALAAALFAVHPLHVESVAWVSERKDVLGVFFGLLAMSAYVRCTETVRPPAACFKSPFYAAALLLFACSLMSKPMLVTLPFVLLLLDFWPLGRIAGWPQGVFKPSVLLAEKLPFLALSAASCVVTVLAQDSEGAVRSTAEFPVAARLSNAAAAYVRYLFKTVWPSDLAVFYPHPGGWGAWRTAGAVLLLAAVSAAAVRQWRRRPWLAAGWFWFLGTLVPVIGLVQVSEQSMADRYSYVPLTGIFVIAAWGLAEGCGSKRRPCFAARTAAVAAVVVCAVLTRLQLRHWQNTETLFSHAVRVTRDNALALNHLSTDLIRQGRLAEAEANLREAVRLRPRFFHAQLSLGNVLARTGRLEEAAGHFAAAAGIDPGSPEAHYNLGNALRALGRTEEAAEHLSAALKWNPDYPEAHAGLAMLLAGRGRMEEAVFHYAETARLSPGDAGACYNLATALLHLGRTEEAVRHYRAALRLQPEFPQAHLRLAAVLLETGDRAGAERHLSEALRLNPDDAEARGMVERLRRHPQ